MPFAVPDSRISKHERLVCYYALPRLLNPFTIGLLAAYVVCLLEAVAALIYGLLTQQRIWTLAGAWALGGIIVLGLTAFTLRALLNDWRKRMALARAQNNPISMESLETPDPFLGHLLLCRSSTPGVFAAESACDKETLNYSVETVKPQNHWRIIDGEKGTTFELMAVQPFRKLLFATHLLEIHEGKKKIGSIRLKHRLRGLRTRIDLFHPEARYYEVVDGCIRLQSTLVGRVYSLRGRLYMDLEHSHLNPGLLACFLICW
ncbi:MAG: hypothetical protein GX130_07820 [Candidatus Hydrogenedens sp.]|nr:hypothetical protein [Candidatus Hydrogenedens sp.]